MHYIAQGTHGAGHNSDLLDWFRILLQRAEKGMAHLMIGDNPPFLFAENPVFLLLPHQHYLNSLEQILLAHGIALVLYRQNRCLIDHIGQI